MLKLPFVEIWLLMAIVAASMASDSNRRVELVSRCDSRLCVVTVLRFSCTLRVVVILNSRRSPGVSGIVSTIREPRMEADAW